MNLRKALTDTPNLHEEQTSSNSNLRKNAGTNADIDCGGCSATASQCVSRKADSGQNACADSDSDCYRFTVCNDRLPRLTDFL